MGTKLKCIAIVLLILIFSSVEILAFKEKDQIECKGGLLSVKVERIQLSELLVKLENATGVRFELVGAVGKREISADFKELSLLKGIEKILHPLSYAVFYRDEKEIDKVIILPEGKDRSTPASLELTESAPREFNASESPETPFGSSTPSIDSGRDYEATSRDDSVPSTGPPGFEKHIDDGPPGAHDKLAEEPPDLKPPEPPPPTEPPPGSSPNNPSKDLPESEDQPDEGVFEGPPGLKFPPSPPPGS